MKEICKPFKLIAIKVITNCKAKIKLLKINLLILFIKILPFMDHTIWNLYL